MPERAQAVAAVGSRGVAADGIARRGPCGVGTYRRRPVAQDTGEKLRLADGLPAAEAVGGPLREGGELLEGCVLASAAADAQLDIALSTAPPTRPG